MRESVRAIDTSPNEIAGLSEKHGRSLALCLKKMAALPEPIKLNFTRLYCQVASGATGTISEKSISPVDKLPTMNEIENTPQYTRRGETELGRAVVIRLNGGLGTSMGLDAAKSLLPVKRGLTFNDLIAAQMLSLNGTFRSQIPLLHMTSVNTNGDIVRAIESCPQFAGCDLPTTFQQHSHPKLSREELLPAYYRSWGTTDFTWNPAGDGDIFAALLLTGVLERLHAEGKEWIFVASADNLGATISTSILGYMADQEIPFLMEATRRLEEDSKEGHLARRLEDQALILREVGQVPRGANGEVSSAFSEIDKYRYISTNSIWLRVSAVLARVREFGGCLPLPLIALEKTVDPRDSISPEVYQLETAMGAAIECFPGARAIDVPRSRFAPVKTTSDLMTVRSDAFELTDCNQLCCVAPFGIPPKVSLDPRYFKMISDYEQRITHTPSLRGASSLTVEGDVWIEAPITIEGDVTLRPPVQGGRLVLQQSRTFKNCIYPS